MIILLPEDNLTQATHVSQLAGISTTLCADNKAAGATITVNTAEPTMLLQTDTASSSTYPLVKPQS